MVAYLRWSLIAGSYERWFYPVAAVVLCTALGLAAERLAIVKGFYASPYMLVVALVAVKYGRHSAYVAAALSALAFDLVFVTPRWVLVWPTNEEWMAYASMALAAHVVGGYRPQAPAQPRRDTYNGDLPFVRNQNDRNAGKRIFWFVQSGGAWIEDCRVGHEYGRIFLDRRQRFGAPLLTWIIRDMIRAGRFSGVEAGFLGVIAGALPRTETTSILLSVSNDNPSDRHSG